MGDGFFHDQKWVMRIHILLTFFVRFNHSWNLGFDRHTFFPTFQSLKIIIIISWLFLVYFSIISLISFLQLTVHRIRLVEVCFTRNHWPFMRSSHHSIRGSRHSKLRTLRVLFNLFIIIWFALCLTYTLTTDMRPTSLGSICSSLMISKYGFVKLR